MSKNPAKKQPVRRKRPAKSRKGAVTPDVRPWIVRNTKLVAEFFGVSAAGVRKWHEEEGYPEKTPAGWDISEINQWRIGRPGRGGRRKGETDDLDDERKREQIRKLRLENARTEGDLVLREEFEGTILRLCDLVRTKLLSLSTTMTAQMETAGTYPEKLAMCEQLHAEALEMIAADAERSLSEIDGASQEGQGTVEPAA